MIPLDLGETSSKLTTLLLLLAGVGCRCARDPFGSKWMSAIVRVRIIILSFKDVCLASGLQLMDLRKRERGSRPLRPPKGSLPSISRWRASLPSPAHYP